MVIRIGAGEAQKALEDKKGGQEGKETNVGFSRDAAGRRDHRCGQIPKTTVWRWAVVKDMGQCGSSTHARIEQCDVPWCGNCSHCSTDVKCSVLAVTSSELLPPQIASNGEYDGATSYNGASFEERLAWRPVVVVVGRGRSICGLARSHAKWEMRQWRILAYKIIDSRLRGRPYNPLTANCQVRIYGVHGILWAPLLVVWRL
ncbi:hypothetical protein POSPLADRAFT_1049919 [Postia placenta MAD-698-R-SB12]|uniref:Uncharacterized protein n=1 Tax=Postia placenta MAD-698-R-SB12 TaxID=670580 RepID=A0A1X6MNM6_9APHY|nr:hypothetical protein POSPLADRAFT_1049919 [Postia placenta MAD-698-R-SB12]OSX57713.1 hypothetical protein POSPLADRAFT_1049919 [Postia placenta MAD-698-R-SB12]